MANESVGTAVLDADRLHALAATGLMGTGPEESFDRITRLCSRILDVPVSLVSLVGADHQFIKSCTGLPEPWTTERRTPLSHSFCQHVVIFDQVLAISDARVHPLVCDNLAVPDLEVVAYLGAPLRTPQNHVLGSFCAIDTKPREWTADQKSMLLDLAAFVATEIEFRRAAAEAEAFSQLSQAVRVESDSETRIRFLADSMPQMVWVANGQGDIRYFNQRWFDYTGMNFEQTKDWGWKPVLHPEDLDRCINEWTSALQTGEPHAREYRLKNKSGEYRWHLCQSVPSRDAAGTIFEWVGTNTDIHDFKIAQEALERSHEELEQRVGIRTAELIAARQTADAANHAKSDFLANMSHEIRTPITAIIGFSELLLNHARSVDEREEYIHIVRRNANHLLDLINDILDLSKIEAGQMGIENRGCDLPGLLSELMSTLRPRAAEKGLHFELSCNGEIPGVIQTDTLRFRQVLMNLLGNAIKFTQRGSVQVTVWFESCSETSLLHVDIKDSGIGLTPEQQGRLFQSFSQADESTTRRFGGTGLGLTISRRLARLLGGDITVNSAAGIGSVFSLTIGCGPTNQLELLTLDCGPGHRQPRLPVIGNEKVLRGRILLAEDGRDNQRLLTTILTAAGAQVSIAENGLIALEQMAAHRFDLVLMDMQMPLMDGYVATTELRRLGYDLPIIALTAHAMAEDRTRCLAAGCSDYLSKPIDSAKLVQRIGHFLEITMPTASDNDDLIQSTMKDVPGFEQIVEQYIAGLPEKVDQLQELCEQRDIDSLRRLVHQLKGSGGGYGFDLITEVAANAESKIDAAGDPASIAEQVNALIEVIRRVRGFNSGSAAASGMRLAK